MHQEYCCPSECKYLGSVLPAQAINSPKMTNKKNKNKNAGNLFTAMCGHFVSRQFKSVTPSVAIMYALARFAPAKRKVPFCLFPLFFINKHELISVYQQ